MLKSETECIEIKNPNKTIMKREFDEALER